MKTRPSILVIYGGGGTEHEVSMISARYIIKTLQKGLPAEVHEVLIDHQGVWKLQSGLKSTLETSTPCFLRPGKKLSFLNQETGLETVIGIDIVIPCIHGPPGETGDLQSHLSMYDIPYLGASPEASKICFNKVSTKLWLNALRIPNTPFVFLDEMNDENFKRAIDFFDQLGRKPEVFVKASSQGSSVGCYPATNLMELKKGITEAFQYSPYVLIEKRLYGRELEISVFEYKGKIHTSYPGEIICPSKFYSYEEKYSPQSTTNTILHAAGLPSKIVEEMQTYAKKAFRALKIQHLSRIDFFLTDKQEIYMNEINTFPGLTPISMFPKMMEASGVTFVDFMKDVIQQCLNKIPSKQTS